MTVTSTTTLSGPYTGDGLTDTYDYQFKVFAAGDLEVTQQDASGLESVLILNTDYTVTGVGDAAGGTIVLASPLPSAYKLVVRRKMAFIQPTDYRNQGGLYPESIETSVDKAAMHAMQLAEESARAVRFPVTDGNAVSNELPTATTRASKYLAFDAAGAAIATSGTSSAAVISTFAETLLDDTTAAAMRTTLGILSAALKNTGTSGDAVPLLNGANTWSAAQTFSAALGGALKLADNELERPKIKDYSETVNALGSIGGGTQDIDLELGNTVTATVDTSATTFTFSNPPASGSAGSFTLILTNGGSQTVNWPASVDWAGGVAPSLTVSGVDVLTFLTTDGGTTWYGFANLDMQ